MTHVRRTATAIGGLLTIGALAVGTPGLAQAATASASAGTVDVAAARFDADRDRNAQDGDGDAEARARATRQGNLFVFGEAEGGGGGGLGNTDTTANARADVTGRFPAADGAYRVTIRYNGARGTDRDRGDGDADVDLRSRVTFGGPDADAGPTLTRVTELSGKPRSRVLKFSYKVPDDASGRIQVQAGLRGTASADSENDLGRFSGRVKGIRISVERVSS